MRRLASDQAAFRRQHPHDDPPDDVVPSVALSSPLKTEDQAAAYLNSTGPTLQRWRSIGYGPAYLKSAAVSVHPGGS